MVAFLRRFLLMKFVLLQFAAPLVHAHVHNSGMIRGLHLHEFETLQIKSDTSYMAGFDSSASLQSAVVDLGAGIDIPRSTQRLSAIYVLYADLLPSQQYVVETINFSPHEAAVIREPFLNQHSSRAPPL